MSGRALPVGLALLADASVPQAPIAALFLTFLAYSFVGWLWESTACALANQGRFANSGFLLGPVCPIYGTGALASWLLLRGITNHLVLFLVAGTLCCAIEYLVGLTLERTTGARFWDYENLPLNIHGRVCLYGFLLFGGAATLVCRVVQPTLLGLLGHLPGGLLVAVALAAAVGLGLDWAFAAASWRRLSTRLEELRAQLALKLNDSLGEASDRMLETIPEPARKAAVEVAAQARGVSEGLAAKLSTDAAPGPRDLAAWLSGAGDAPRALATWLQDAAESLVGSLGKRDLRFFNAFPRLRFNRYERLISVTHLKDRVSDLFDGRR